MQIQKLSLSKCKLNDLTNIAYSNNLDIDKIQNCPYCGISSDHKKIDTQVFDIADNYKFLVIHWECTLCKKRHVQLHKINVSKSEAFFISSYPPVNRLLSNNPFIDVSPRFHDIYSQVLFCEYNNQFDLAAMGMRSALEVLCKDFAIAKLGAIIDDVKDLRLADVIYKYYPESELKNSANIIRILGNDYSHYQKKYSEHDYFTIKKYFDAFLCFLEYKLVALTPLEEYHQSDD